MLHIPKREESISHTHYGYSLAPTPNPNNPHTGPSPSLPSMDKIMIKVAGPSALSHKFRFGIDCVNKLISQMPKQPIFNIVCQKSSKIRVDIRLLGNWLIYKKSQDSTISLQQLTIQIITCFLRIAREWWRWLPQETRDEMLASPDADQQILSAIGRQFYGPNNDEDYDHLTSLFMSQRLCDLEKHEQYFCYMQNLLITSGNADKP
jgi:hypothetical protein